MKKHNKCYAMPMPGGEVVYIIAKSINHMKKILHRTDVIFDYDCFEDWGKFSQLSKEWEINLSKLYQRSGIAYMNSYGKRYWIKQK